MTSVRWASRRESRSGLAALGPWHCESLRCKDAFGKQHYYFLTVQRCSLARVQVYLSLSERSATGGCLERATAGAAAAIDSLSGEAAKAVKQLRKSLTAVVKKSGNSATKAQPSDAIAALGENRHAPTPRARLNLPGQNMCFCLPHASQTTCFLITPGPRVRHSN